MKSLKNREQIIFCLTLVTIGVIILSCVVYASSKWAPQVVETNRKEYPAVQVVQYSIEDVNEKLNLYIQKYHFFKAKIIFRNKPTNSLMSAEGRDKNIMAKRHLIFENPDNKYDVYIYDDTQPICYSSVYRLNNINAAYWASFHVHLQSLGPNETKISVFSFDNEIPGGTKWEWGHAGFWPYPQGQVVQPTGVEENELLNFIVERIIIRFDDKYFEDNDLPPGRCK